MKKDFRKKLANLDYDIFLSSYNKNSLIIRRKLSPRIPYAVMSAICLLGGLAASFLPETLGMELPETVLEADTFGYEHEFFSWMPNDASKDGQKEDEEEGK